MKKLIKKIIRYGLAESGRKLIIILKRKSGYYKWKYKNIKKYISPSDIELKKIEEDLIRLGVSVHDYSPSLESFKMFKSENWFSNKYHGGVASGVWNEKLLEHWISKKLLGITNLSSSEIYVDIAAASSPWAHNLVLKGVNAVAIDLMDVGDAYINLPYYRVEDATHTSFQDNSVKAVSLHCAYEMFMGEDDINLIYELNRILVPGGKAVILPIYMHTHYCAYSTPEYFGLGFHDMNAEEYVRMDCCGVPSSRKYSPTVLKSRVLDTITSCGMQYNLKVLRNKKDFGSDVYCHFILEIVK